METRLVLPSTKNSFASQSASLLCLTGRPPHGKMMAARESPSGKASAFQADIRGFESRLPLRESASVSRFRCPSRDTGHWSTSCFSGLVAQRLAQATHNRLVAGSNPAGPTKQPNRGWDYKPKSAYSLQSLYGGRIGPPGTLKTVLEY
jgi:hypothetical protein